MTLGRQGAELDECTGASLLLVTGASELCCSSSRRGESPAQMLLAADNDLVQAFATDGPVPVANSIRLARDRELGDEIGACGTCSA